MVRIVVLWCEHARLGVLAWHLSVLGRFRRRTRFHWLVALPIVVAAACGGNPLAPPTADEIIAMPASSNMRDAHFGVSGTASGATFNGDG